MIDLQTEKSISLAAAARTLLPQPTGRPLSPASQHRWASRGVLAGDGTRVVLETVRVGRAFFTTESAVRNFLNELSRRSGIQQTTRKLTSDIDAALTKKGLK